MFRFLTAGESHGKALNVILEGIPSGLAVEVDNIADELSRRRLGYGRGPRMRFERDDVEILGGIRHGVTLGSPISIVIHNSEWPKWEEEMSVAPGSTNKKLTQPRPGHADLPGMRKYDLDDARNVLERASARETAARVAAGTIAKLVMRELGTEIMSHVLSIGQARVPEGAPRPDFSDLATIDANEVRCFSAESTDAIIAEIKAAAKAGDSLGGVVEVLGFGVPEGLGSHVHWDRKIDGLLAQSLMSIQAIKAVEIGDGFDNAYKWGSEAHDEILYDTDHYVRPTARAGGVEGGITNGSLLVCRAWMKPLASLNRPVIRTTDVETKEETVSFKERTDVTAVPAAGVVAETMVALTLMSEASRKFGGDSMKEFLANARNFSESLD
ncbi:MAG TPA: chorismate synthase [Acidimicrobiia bacterium]|nr:chorismate synthase [Acidimicrobiia bacterium]